VAIRARRALVGLATAAAVLILPASALAGILPASALAAGETMTVTPASTQAGAGTSVTATLGFAAGDTPKTVVTSLAPGMLGNLNANLSCLASQQLTAACQIGTATAHSTVGDVAGTLYLVPAQGTDAAGIEFVPPGPPLSNQYIGVSLNPNAPGGLNLTTTFTNIPGVQITGFTTNFTTLNGQPFTRLPSSCSAATSSFTATYYGATPTGSASGSFTPTGCASLPYAPALSATETKDHKGNGVTLAFGITQAANEAASRAIALKLPGGLGINLAADVTCLTGSGSGCVVGTATAMSPLVPSAALSKGTVSLGGTAAAPTLTIAFPAPFAITLVGNVSLAGTVAFPDVPDVPLTSLNLTLTGPNGQKAFTTNCTPSTTTGTFTSQSGVSKNATATVTRNNCPTASGSLSGLAAGYPKLRVKATQGKGGTKIASVAVGFSGLKFSRSAFVTHKTCVTKSGQKTCTTTTLIKGLGLSGAGAKSVALKGGKLVIMLKKPVASVTVNLSGPLLTETASLQTKVKKHKVKTLTVTLEIGTTTIPLELLAH